MKYLYIQDSRALCVFVLFFFQSRYPFCKKGLDFRWKIISLLFVLIYVFWKTWKEHSLLTWPYFSFLLYVFALKQRYHLFIANVDCDADRIFFYVPAIFLLFFFFIYLPCKFFGHFSKRWVKPLNNLYLLFTELAQVQAFSLLSQAKEIYFLLL